MSTGSDLRALARQGNPRAIAILITRSFRAQGITVRASRENDQIRIVLEAAEVPEPQAVIERIRRGFERLEVQSIRTVRLHGKQIGQDLAWSQNLEYSAETATFELVESNTPLATQPSEPAALSSVIESTVTSELEGSEPEEVFRSREERTSDRSTQINNEALPRKATCALIISIWFQILREAAFVVPSLFGFATTYIGSTSQSWEVSPPDTNPFTFSISYLWNYVVALLYFFNRFEVWIYIALSVIFLVWIYQLHVSLKNIFGSYPISPWEAVAYFALPFVNLIAVWKVFGVLAEELIDLGGETARYGAFIQRRIPSYYILLVALWLLSWLYFISNIILLALYVVWLRIMLHIDRGLNEAIASDK